VTVADESRRAAPELALRVVRERGDFAEPYANTVGIRLKIPFSSGPLVRRETSAAQAEADQADAEMVRAQTRIQLEAERAERALLHRSGSSLWRRSAASSPPRTFACPKKHFHSANPT
jgi:cobalt-zinc-cadmium efflux system outer membrane protein